MSDTEFGVHAEKHGLVLHFSLLFLCGNMCAKEGGFSKNNENTLWLDVFMERRYFLG